jgi:primase-polymerase (primpol)-like protein
VLAPHPPLGPGGSEGEEGRVSLELVPAQLRHRRQWVCWRYEARGGKTTKVPYQAHAPARRASTTDPTTWASLEQTAAAAQVDRADGVGYVFAADDPFTGIDLDECFDPETGSLVPAVGLLVLSLDSYTEQSPSGKGLHVIVRARLEGGRCRRGPIEIYDRGRYFAMTGERVVGLPVEAMPRQAELDGLRGRLFPPAAEPRRSVSPPSVLGLDDEELLRRAFAARNGGQVERLWNGVWAGYGSRSEADLALVSHLAFWTGGDPERIDRLFRRSGLYREKWDARRGETTYGAETIARALG